ncbi:MAG TPA: hypothetical protein VHP36_08490 [Chitinispirillaceae bacterium]|nr:hypothetical protein [Chitinispirillaceae bacterium]
MKALLSLSAILILTLQTQAQDTIVMRSTPRFEIGALLGEPIGLSLKFWHGTITATDLSAAWSFTENGVFEMHLDFLVHPFNLRAITQGNNFPFYIGAGFAARVGDDWFLGARLPIGVEYMFNSFPLSIFGEVAPQWQFFPDDDFVLSGGVGIRLLFGSIE